MKMSELIEQLESFMEEEGDCDLVTSFNEKPPIGRLLCRTNENEEILVGVFSLVED